MSIKKIAVIGAGLVGSAIALYLAKLGLQVHIFERRADPRQHHKDKGRSINLALSHRGLRTLSELNLTAAVLKQAVPVYGRCVHQANSTLSYQPYSHRKTEFNYSISRQGFNQILMDAVEKSDKITLEFEKNFDVNNFDEYDFYIAADGASSHIRRYLNNHNQLNFKEEYSEHAYLEFILKAEDTKGLDPHHLHIWPCHDFMFMALPNFEGSFTGTLFMPENKFSEIRSQADIKNFFQNYFFEVTQLLPDYQQQFQAHKPSVLKTVQGDSWLWQQKLLFIGDSAHAMLPYLGQGMNCGLEDCRILNELIIQQKDFLKAVKIFAEDRKKDTDAITELSCQNYYEMCHKVVDEKFLKLKEQEAQLSQQDKSFQSLYQKITYTSIPYRELLPKA